MLRIELIFDASCPNVEAARIQLRRALDQAGLSSYSWQEWSRAVEGVPTYVSGYGSPTILINGHDVEKQEALDSVSCCRIYIHANGRLKGVPAVQTIVEAIQDAGIRT
jgi:mercuric ion transport protein